VESYDLIVIGAGVTGLAFANAIRDACAAPPTVLVLEAADEPGGYCRTVLRDGFVWDYSGHFFHFRHPEIETWLRDRMPADEVRTVSKCSKIRFADRWVDFPFQRHIHQLPREDFLACLVDLFDATEARRCGGRGGYRSFREMVVGRLGRAIAERFLIPYNEKLYACDLDDLDAGAMERFFPEVELADVIDAMRRGAEDASYNATFTYPRGGAVQYIRALLADLPREVVRCSERVTSVDLQRQVVTTDRGEIRYGRLVSSTPLPELLEMCGLQHDRGAFSANAVQVFNLGFDRKGPERIHWLYEPSPSIRFYRVGFYDNIHADDRMSLYVEIGVPAGTAVDEDVELDRVLAELREIGVVRDHRLVASHVVRLDPGYVHLSERSRAETARVRAVLNAAGVYPVGRYGGWTYCSIEDNIVEARALAATLAPVL
jgi:protoporphyrinogen oxidase